MCECFILIPVYEIRHSPYLLKRVSGERKYSIRWIDAIPCLSTIMVSVIVYFTKAVCSLMYFVNIYIFDYRDLQ
jgi:hypothetical protein